MTTLVGNTSIANFTSTVSINSNTGGGPDVKANFSSDLTNALVAANTGLAQNLELYINSWGSQTQIKVCLYGQAGNLIESVIVSSAVGTGLVEVMLSGLNTVTATQQYSIGIYTPDANPIALWSDNRAQQPYIYISDFPGGFDTPQDPRVAGSYGGSLDVFYWAINDVVASEIITDTTDPVVDQVANTITTSGLTGIPSGTLGGAPITITGSFPNLGYTINVAESENATGPDIGSGQQLAVTGTEGTATTSVTTQPKSGWAVVTLAGTLNKDPGSLLAAIEAATGQTVVVGDRLYYDTSGNTSIDATGTLTTDASTVDVNLGQGGSATTATTWYYLEIDFGGGGGGGKLTATKLTATKLTARKL